MNVEGIVSGRTVVYTEGAVSLFRWGNSGDAFGLSVFFFRMYPPIIRFFNIVDVRRISDIKESDTDDSALKFADDSASSSRTPSP